MKQFCKLMAIVFAVELIVWLSANYLPDFVVNIMFQVIALAVAAWVIAFLILYLAKISDKDDDAPEEGDEP